MKNEIWKDVKGYEGLYMVSNLGRVKSLDRKVKHKYGGLSNIKGMIIKPSLIKNTGYYRVNFSRNSKIKTCFVHVIVANNFIKDGYLKFKLQCNHIDGDKSNNKLSNIEVVTKSENELHAFRIGLKSLKGEKHNHSKLTQIEVDEIRAKYVYKKITFKMLSKVYGVTISTIQHIIQKRTWK